MKIILKLICVSTLLFCSIYNAEAQTYADLARTFSETNIGGTARMQAIGGAQTSLGGDISSIYSNPAGLGFYTRSEFAISPSLNFHNTNSTYLGSSLEDNKNNLNIGSLGIVFNKSKDDAIAGAWRGGSFGISISRINDYHNSVSYRGTNNEDDFVGYTLNKIFYDENDNVQFDDIYAELAYETYLLSEFYDPEDDVFFLDRYNDVATSPGFPVQQTETIITNGATYQTTIAYGGNFSDKFYIGANIGILSLNYEQERLFREVPTGTSLNNLVLSDVRELNGSGFNVGLGVIYRPINTLTLGVSYKSPSYYSLEDASSVDLISNFNDSTNQFGLSFTPFSFNLKTPSRLNGGISYFFGKNGFISADVELLDYSKNHFSRGENFLDIENDEINNTFQTAINYRVGGEYRFNIFRFRAGYSYYGDPVEGVDELDRSRQSISAGVGLRFRDYFVDLTVVNRWYDFSIRPYPTAPLAVTENNTISALFTVGLNF